MVGHRRVATLAAAFLVAFMVPTLAPPGAARAVQADPAGWPAPFFYTLSGVAVGRDGGSLEGGAVSACSTGSWGCFSATIGWNGSFAMGVAAPGTYRVSISPPLPYAFGYYAAWDIHGFTTDQSQASDVIVNNQDISLLTMYVPRAYVPPPPSWGSISGYVVGAWSGSLAGGTVTACTVGWTCSTVLIGSDGWYWIGSLHSGSYVVSIAPPPYSPYVSGYYASWAVGHFTADASSATAVDVWNANVTLPTIVVPAYYPAYGSISGYVVGAYAGSMAGGTVTACDSVYWSCTSATIGWDGWYSIGVLGPGSYRVSITPPYSYPYLGYYASWAAGNFTTNASSATWVSVWYSNVTLPTIVVPCSYYYPYPCPWYATPVVTPTVPPNTGGIVVVTPQKYIVRAFLRPEFSTGTTPTLRIAEGSRAELASQIDPKLAGMRVDVWRKLAGQGWVLITTRGISGSGWVIYRFTATAGTAGAQYRFHLPATSLTVSVWSVARTVRLL